MSSPCVKGSLKSRILGRRPDFGLGTVVIDFSPKPTYPMSQEEVEKDWRRKESNRRSAMKSRIKLKEQDEMIQKKLEKEKERHSKLNEIWTKLEQEKKEYINALTMRGVSTSDIQHVLIDSISNNSSLEKEENSSDSSGNVLEGVSSPRSDSDSCSTYSGDTQFDGQRTDHLPTILYSTFEDSDDILTIDAQTDMESFGKSSQEVCAEAVEMLNNIDIDTLDHSPSYDTVDQTEGSKETFSNHSETQNLNSILSSSELIIQGNYPTYYSNHIPSMRQLLTGY